ncbi:MAG: ABC transporter substrate-binding protein [Pseudoflavonifractor sp.]|nr:ABC transporter substrate-binding protein [Pseudoflavonifractor sp.]
MKKRIALVLSLILLMGLFAGCSKQETTTKVRLNEVTHSVFYAPMYAALKLGFFEEEGLDVELTNGGGADKVMTAVLAGQADVGLAGPEACIYVLNEGREDYPVVFAQLTKRDGSFLVGRTNEPFLWENLKGSTIIGGRKGGVPEMTLEYVLRQNGVVPNEDATVDTSVQFNMMAGAFTGGNGDYVTLFEPTATEVELEGKGYVLTSIGQESGEIPYTAFFAAQSYIKENQQAIQSFANAIAKGQKWVQEHTAKEIAEAITDQFPDTKLDVLTLVAQRYKDIDAWNDTPVMKQESLERLETVMETAGELDQRVDFAKLVDNTYAEKAAAD